MNTPVVIPEPYSTIVIVFLWASLAAATAAIVYSVYLVFSSGDRRPGRKVVRYRQISAALAKFGGPAFMNERQEAWMKVRLPLRRVLILIEAGLVPEEAESRTVRQLTNRELEIMTYLHRP